MAHLSLTSAPAGEELLALARAPHDLTRPGGLTPERLERYRAQGADWELFYATQRLDDRVLAVLARLAEECGLVTQFKAMRRGAVMNRIDGFASENRQVLHTACRDLFSDSPAAPEATALAKQELDRLAAFLGELADGRVCGAQGQAFATLVQVGIGGSDLGPRAIYEALRAWSLPGRQVRFIANVDPDDAAAVLAGLDPATTLFNVVSKSGSTQETAANEALVRSWLLAAGLDPVRHMVCVTAPGSPMDNPERFLHSFYMTESVGGRYSASSMVGLVALGFALGMEQVMDFLRGAAAMDQAAEQENLAGNLPLLLALIGIWNHNFLGAATQAVLPYSQALHRFPAHLQQCDMESNGKAVTRSGDPVALDTGPVIWGEPGTNGQHAFYQLLHQGTEWVPVEFIGLRNSQFGRDVEEGGSSSQDKLLANLLAQSLALALGRDSDNPNQRFVGNRVSSLLLADRLTPQAMGGLLALYEAKIVFQGFCWDINSFDQEGVQLGKVLAAEVLAAMGREQEGASVLAQALVELTRTGPENPCRQPRQK